MADREMIDHLSLLGRQVEIAMNFLIVECADACGSQPERFRGEIQTVADGARFEMHVAISPVAVSTHCTLQIANHRKRHAGVPGEILPEAQGRGRDALISGFDSLQFGMLGPESIDAGFEPLDAMDVQIKLDELQHLCGRSEDGRELGQ